VPAGGGVLRSPPRIGRLRSLKRAEDALQRDRLPPWWLFQSYHLIAKEKVLALAGL
jgi:hypothetical protein